MTRHEANGSKSAEVGREARAIDWSRQCWRRLRRVAAPVRDLLLANRCTQCDAELAAPAGGCLICPRCRLEMLGNGSVRCPRCAEPLPADGCTACGSCRERCPSFERAWTLGAYSGQLRAAVLKMKHPNAEPLAAALAELLYEQLGESIRDWRPDAVLPVPMHWLRRSLRGANSAETLSSILSKRLRLPHATGCIVRRRHTRPQSGLAAGDRFRNVRGAFRLRRGIPWKATRILVVDDILTTGATCGEIAGLLLGAGASAVATVVAARAAGIGPR